MEKTGKTNDINRVDELRSLLKSGKQFLGFFDGLLLFYSEITPLLMRINQSIEDSSSKLPRASTSLNRVTKETERATIEILDILEIVSQTIEEERKRVEEYKIRKKKRTDAILECIGLFEPVAHTLPGNDGDKFKNLMSVIKADFEDEELLSSMPAFFNKIADYTTNISISLQVQDITSQQLAAVNHLVESVHLRLKQLLDNYGEGAVSFVPEIAGSDPSTFDADAQYDRSHDKQYLADILSEKHRPSAAAAERSGTQSDVPKGHNLSTQAEIDKLFGS